MTDPVAPWTSAEASQLNRRRRRSPGSGRLARGGSPMAGGCQSISRAGWEEISIMKADWAQRSNFSSNYLNAREFATEKQTP
jgi:hypothetical protein